jgi:hypothetical protein
MSIWRRPTNARPGLARQGNGTTGRGPVQKLVVKLATANPRWGYTKIRDALHTGLGIEISRTTIANILAEAGIEPAPEREKTRTWKQFMKAHWDSLCGCDFFTISVGSWSRLRPGRPARRALTARSPAGLGSAAC